MSAEAGAPGTEEKIAPEMIEARIKALRGELVNGEISEAFLADAVLHHLLSDEEPRTRLISFAVSSISTFRIRIVLTRFFLA